MKKKDLTAFGIGLSFISILGLICWIVGITMKEITSRFSEDEILKGLIMIMVVLYTPRVCYKIGKEIMRRLQ